MAVTKVDDAHHRVLEQVLKVHSSISPDIDARLAEFESLWQRQDQHRMFLELVFCLLTPQSRARSCWEAVEMMDGSGLLLRGDCGQLAELLRTRSRFHRTKSERLVMARQRFMVEGRHRIGPMLQAHSGPEEMRSWLVSEVNGIGYKEASHFLRNIGLGKDLAILDRHILKNLVLLGVMDRVPASLGPKHYIETEARMAAFARKVPIRMDHLDLVLWYMQTGHVFK